MPVMHHGLQTLFAALANRGLAVLAWYEREHAIGLVLACGHVVELERRRACGEPYAVADMLAAHLPRRSVARDYDPAAVPEINPATAQWWVFLRWCVMHESEVKR